MHTGQLEGINNRIEVIRQMAYGHRDSAFLFVKVKAVFPGNPRRTRKGIGKCTSRRKAMTSTWH
jgi:hypothetical protein